MNTRMICYILGKMLGVEALLLLVPAFVGALYDEREGIAFLIPSAILLLFSHSGAKEAGKDEDIWKGRPDHRGIGMDIVVFVWGTPLYHIRRDSELCRCTF